jgi:hypothetical protein
MRYNAILLENYEPKTVKNNHIQYAGKFLIAINDNTDMKTIIASQLNEPINAELRNEFILDIFEREYNHKTYYNIRPKSSYTYMPFPKIKCKVTYCTYLDGNGYDHISHQYFPEYSYEEVEICKTLYYNHGELDKSDYNFEVVNHTDYAHVRNENPVLQNVQEFTDVDYKRLIEALRDYLPIEEHPNKHLYTASEIFKQYREVHNLRNAVGVPLQYGSDISHCICGHEIQEICYCEYMSNKGKDGISKSPLGAIGNCCIKKMAWKSGLYTRLLTDVYNNFQNGIFKFESDISKKNGFGDIQMEFLQKCVLTTDEFECLQSILTSKRKWDLDDAVYRILCHITKFYEVNYDKTFNNEES